MCRNARLRIGIDRGRARDGAGPPGLGSEFQWDHGRGLGVVLVELEREAEGAEHFVALKLGQHRQPGDEIAGPYRLRGIGAAAIGGGRLPQSVGKNLPHFNS